MRPRVALHEIVTPGDSVLATIGVPKSHHRSDAASSFIEIVHTHHNVQDRFRQHIRNRRAAHVLDTHYVLLNGCKDSGPFFRKRIRPEVMCSP